MDVESGERGLQIVLHDPHRKIVPLDAREETEVA
jgi:hypothetical protein